MNYNPLNDLNSFDPKEQCPTKRFSPTRRHFNFQKKEKEKENKDIWRKMGKKIERMKCRPKCKAGKEKERVEGNEIMLTCISLKHGFKL